MLVNDPAIVAWAALRLGNQVVQPSAAIGWIDRAGILTAAALFHDYYPKGNIDLCLVCDGKFSRRFFLALADYVFVQLECKRVTARPPRSNREAHDMLRRAGFTFEVGLPGYYGEDDATQFVLKPDKCKWLTHERPFSP